MLERRGPLLIVQRTGWGKSNVYFIATKLLREENAGPTLIVSPLLALMRNQIAAASFAIQRCDEFVKPVLLVDDMVDSRWTFTVCAALLRQAGSGVVLPIALAQTSKNDET